MSFDGGRHCARQISPELSAHTRRFFRQVPDVEHTELRLKLRYHRDGHEIEAGTHEALRMLARGDDPAAPRRAPIAAETGAALHPVRRGEPGRGVHADPRTEFRLPMPSAGPGVISWNCDAVGNTFCLIEPDAGGANESVVEVVTRFENLVNRK